MASGLEEVELVEETKSGRVEGLQFLGQVPEGFRARTPVNSLVHFH